MLSSGSEPTFRNGAIFALKNQIKKHDCEVQSWSRVEPIEPGDVVALCDWEKVINCHTTHRRAITWNNRTIACVSSSQYCNIAARS